MADDTNEDSWLYGTSNPDSTTNEEERVDESGAGDAGFEKENSQQLSKSENEALAAVIQGDDVNALANKDDEPPGDSELVEFEDPAHEMEEDEEATADTTEEAVRRESEEKPVDGSDQGAADDDDDDEDDDSDDDINVVIGDIKAAPSTYNIKQRSNLLAGASGQEKSKSAAQVGKFSIEDFEGAGTINGVAAHEFSIDSLEDKPWRKPGADITDYFNYGFNEETWRAYCERQKRFRVVESGVGLASLTQNLNPPAEKIGEGSVPIGQQMGTLPPGHTPPGHLGEHIQMPPPGMMPPPGPHQGPPPRFGMPRGPRPMPPVPGTKENAIQVMTAECREYSRPGQLPPNFGGPPGGGEEAFFHEPEPFDYGYEPTQDSQWGSENPNWVPTGIKELTPGPNAAPPPQMTGPPGMMGVPPPQMGGPPPQMRHPLPQPNIIGGIPPNIGMVPPPMGMMMGPGGPGGPPMRMPMGPPRMMGPNGPPPDRLEDDRERRRREREWERERERDRDRERSRRERSRSREKSRRRSKSRDKDRDKERDRERDRERVDRERDRERNDKETDNERTEEERERRRRDRERDRERDRGERDRERSRRERSRSREKSRRRSKSREKERDRSSKVAATSTTSSSSRSDKKKSHRKEDGHEE